MTGLITTPRLGLLRLFKPCGRQTNMAPIISTSWSSCSCIISLSWFIGLLLVEKVQQKSHDFTFKVGLWLPSCVPSLVWLALEETSCHGLWQSCGNSPMSKLGSKSPEVCQSCKRTRKQRITPLSLEMTSAPAEILTATSWETEPELPSKLFLDPWTTETFR